MYSYRLSKTRDVDFFSVPRYDAISTAQIKDGDVVCVCDGCGAVCLESSWEANDNRCGSCDCLSKRYIDEQYFHQFRVETQRISHTRNRGTVSPRRRPVTTSPAQPANEVHTFPRRPVAASSVQPANEVHTLPRRPVTTSSAQSANEVHTLPRRPVTASSVQSANEVRTLPRRPVTTSSAQSANEVHTLPRRPVGNTAGQSADRAQIVNARLGSNSNAAGSVRTAKTIRPQAYPSQKKRRKKTGRVLLGIVISLIVIAIAAGVIFILNRNGVIDVSGIASHIGLDGVINKFTANIAGKSFSVLSGCSNQARLTVQHGIYY